MSDLVFQVFRSHRTLSQYYKSSLLATQGGSHSRDHGQQPTPLQMSLSSGSEVRLGIRTHNPSERLNHLDITPSAYYVPLLSIYCLELSIL